MRVRYTREGWSPGQSDYIVQALDEATWHIHLPLPEQHADWLELHRVLGRIWTLLVTKTDADNKNWYVAAADPDDPTDYPYRSAVLLRADYRASGVETS